MKTEAKALWEEKEFSRGSDDWRREMQQEIAEETFSELIIAELINYLSG